MSLMVWVVVLFFNAYNQESLIVTVFDLAGYTYGPLLGLYTLGLLTKVKPIDAWVPYLSVFSMISSFLLKTNSKALFGGYEIGFEILIINGLITFLALWATSFFRKQN